MRSLTFAGIYITLFTLLFAACKNPAPSTTTTTDSTTVYTKVQDTVPTEVESEYADYYVAIADTGHDYYTLDKLMYRLGSSLNIKVDTMNRYYNKEKKRIVLPDNDEDEMYRGDYYPRRGGEDFLSIEYTLLFDTSATANNMCVVAGIFAAKKSADSLLALIKPAAPNAFVIKAAIYQGCLH